MTVIFSGAPKQCDICKGEFSGVMFDARTRQGPWGCLCGSCFRNENGKLGTGLGQKYLTNSQGKWELSNG